MEAIYSSETLLLTQVEMLTIPITEVNGSNIGRGNDFREMYHGFPQPLGSILIAVHNSCLPYSLSATILPLTKLNSVSFLRKQTIPTERPPLVGEVTANFCG
jgi:hypothetical protein